MFGSRLSVFAVASLGLHIREDRLERPAEHAYSDRVRPELADRFSFDAGSRGSLHGIHHLDLVALPDGESNGLGLSPAAWQ